MLSPARPHMRLVAPARPEPRHPDEIHAFDCECPECGADGPLRVRHVLKLTAFGIGTGTAIAAAIDPAGTGAIIVDLLRFWFL